MLSGKGFFIWQIGRTENGNVQAIADLAVQSGLSHVLIKIADGVGAYNINASGQDLALSLVGALRRQNIQVWGWHYVYGYDPAGEAAIAVQRVQQLGLDGYVIDAEAQYKQPGKEEAAIDFLEHLRRALPDCPVALSSYRYPSYHPDFPWQAFLSRVDLSMPQVYWVAAHNPAEQLARCLREYQNLSQGLPLIPVGAAYLESGWSPTIGEVNEFLSAAQTLNCPAANFWEWANCRGNLPTVWSAIADYPWPASLSDLDIAQRYIYALNSRDPDVVTSLYTSQAVHIDPSGSRQGKTAIRAWYERLFTGPLAGATYYLGGFNVLPDARQLSWVAYGPGGCVQDGYDLLDLKTGWMDIHNTQFTIRNQIQLGFIAG
jgi:hypothetical protein